jgi:hypothetical protein
MPSYRLRIALLTGLCAACGQEELPLDVHSKWQASLGPDLCGAPALSSDGLAIVPRIGLGVALSERTGPNGETRRGVSSASTAGALYAIDSSGTKRWSVGLGA